METNTSQIADYSHTQSARIVVVPNESPYADIIRLPHPVSRTHPQMSLHGRAAQFAPFAALTGYESVIAETAHRVQEIYDNG